MKESTSPSFSWPELGLASGSRLLLGSGLALLLGERLTQEQRKAMGWTLFTIGTMISIPLGFRVLSKQIASRPETGISLRSAA